MTSFMDTFFPNFNAVTKPTTITPATVAPTPGSSMIVAPTRVQTPPAVANPTTILTPTQNRANAGAVTCLTPYQLLTRRQYRSYAGPAVTGTGGYVYVLSDSVPVGRYWLLMKCDLLPGKGVALVGDGIGLFVVPGGTKLPTIIPGASQVDPFFLDYRALGAGRNDGPISAGWRIDDGSAIGQLTSSVTSPIMSEQQNMLRDRNYELLAPGDTLIGYNHSGGTPCNPGSFIEMRIAYAEMTPDETYQPY